MIGGLFKKFHVIFLKAKIIPHINMAGIFSGALIPEYYIGIQEYRKFAKEEILNKIGIDLKIYYVV